MNLFILQPPGAAVMVWFHGGGYSLGISTSTSYDPISLLSVASDVIFVSANYRLGVLGFLSTGTIPQIVHPCAVGHERKTMLILENDPLKKAFMDLYHTVIYTPSWSCSLFP